MLQRNLFGVAIAAGTFLSLANAQNNAQGDPTDRRTDRKMQDPAHAGSARHGDAMLVNWLIADNEKEIALAQLAQQRAQDPAVKQFAEQMIKDHGEMLQKLRSALGGPDTIGGVGHPGSGTPPAGRDAGATGRQDPKDPAATGKDPMAKDPMGKDPMGKDPMGKDPMGKEPGQTAQTGEARELREARDASGMGQLAARPGAGGGNLDPVALVRDLARKCTESATQALSAKQGAEFDRCYMGMAVMDHMGAVDKLTVFGDHASERLKPTLAEGLRTVQQHLEHAKSLAKKTEGKPAGGQ